MSEQFYLTTCRNLQIIAIVLTINTVKVFFSLLKEKGATMSQWQNLTSTIWDSLIWVSLWPSANWICGVKKGSYLNIDEWYVMKMQSIKGNMKMMSYFRCNSLLFFSWQLTNRTRSVQLSLRTTTDTINGIFPYFGNLICSIF